MYSARHTAATPPPTSPHGEGRAEQCKAQVQHRKLLAQTWQKIDGREGRIRSSQQQRMRKISFVDERMRMHDKDVAYFSKEAGHCLHGWHGGKFLRACQIYVEVMRQRIQDPRIFRDDEDQLHHNQRPDAGDDRGADIYFRGRPPDPTVHSPSSAAQPDQTQTKNSRQMGIDTTRRHSQHSQRHYAHTDDLGRQRGSKQHARRHTHMEPSRANAAA